jgi:hypothetical protein
MKSSRLLLEVLPRATWSFYHCHPSLTIGRLTTPGGKVMMNREDLRNSWKTQSLSYMLPWQLKLDMLKESGMVSPNGQDAFIPRIIVLRLSISKDRENKVVSPNMPALNRFKQSHKYLQLHKNANSLRTLFPTCYMLPCPLGLILPMMQI